MGFLPLTAQEGPGEMRLEHHEGDPGVGDRPADRARLHKINMGYQGISHRRRSVGKLYGSSAAGDIM